jgi:hypothetical protein
MNIQNDDITPATSQYDVWNPITNELYPLHCWYDSLMYEKACTLFMIFIPSSIEKCIFACWFSATSAPVKKIRVQ